MSRASSYEIVMALRDSLAQLKRQTYYGTASSLHTGRQSAKIASQQRQAALRGLKKIGG